MQIFGKSINHCYKRSFSCFVLRGPFYSFISISVVFGPGVKARRTGPENLIAHFLILNMERQITSILKILTLAERLKFELRHSYTSNGRQESVAEHTWRMSLMAVLIEPLLKQKIDPGRLLKMIILHDLV